MAEGRKRALFRLSGRAVEIFGRRISLPASRLGRIGVGVLLILGGCLAVLPVFGVWMLPLGLLILSMDIAIVRRWRRRSDVRVTRWRLARRAAKDAGAPLRR